MIDPKSGRILSVAAMLTFMGLGVAGPLRADGLISQGAALWYVPPGHFDGTPEIDFVGINPVPGADHVAQAGWWYRLSGDSAETFFPDPDIETYVGNTATFAWVNVNGTGLDVTETQVLTNIGGGFRLRSTLQVRNGGGSPVTLDIYHALDLDLNGTNGDDSGTLAIANTEIAITDGGTISGVYRGIGATNYAVRTAGGGTDTIGLLNDGDVDDFDNTGLPFGPADQTLGFQWDDTVIGPGNNVEFVSELALTRPFVPPAAHPITIGYFANNDSGRGTAFFVNTAPPVNTNNHRIRIRNSNGNLIHSVVLPYTGPGTATGVANIQLPLADAHPKSWETGIQVIIDARQNGLILQTLSFSYLGHASSDLDDFQFVVPPIPSDPPGVYGALLTDSRPTGQTNHYAYDLIRRTFAPMSTTQVGQANHGILGAYPITADHALTVIPVSLPAVSGEQIFWTRPRILFKNSAGANLGRYDIAPKSPNLYAQLSLP